MTLQGAFHNPIKFQFRKLNTPVAADNTQLACGTVMGVHVMYTGPTPSEQKKLRGTSLDQQKVPF